MSTYVLVHGSWHAAWCWYKITARLQAAGHKAIVPDLPGLVVTSVPKVPIWKVFSFSSLQ